MSKKLAFIMLLVFFLINLAWLQTSSFWFNNVDLSYMQRYINFEDPIGGFDFVKSVRGHVLLQLLTYSIFNLNPAPYYLLANSLHALATVGAFLVLYRLFKNSNLALIFSLIFGINIAYSDVLFNGSFNQYYPFLLLLIFVSLLLVWNILRPQIQAKTGIIQITFVSLLLTLGLLFRETILLLPILATAFLLVFSKDKRKLSYLIPLFLISLLYLGLRARVLGELFSDLTDDAVQARMAFLVSGRYLSWGYYSFINFFRIIAEQIIPHPLLYGVRGFLLNKLSLGREAFSVAYVTLVGVSAFGLILLLVRKTYQGSKNLVVRHAAVYGLLWTLLGNLFIAFALPFPGHVLSNDYSFETVLSRYNYFGFFGIILVIAAYSSLYFYKRDFTKKSLILVLGYLLVQFVLVQYGAHSLYKNKHLKAKHFYSQFFSNYPQLPRQTVIYYNFFQINNLRDYVGDLKYVFSKKFYPNTIFTLETSLAHVQEEYSKGSVGLNEILALDLDKEGFLVDRTGIAREVLTSQRPVRLGFKREGESFQAIPKNGDDLYANLEYILNFEGRGWVDGLQKKSKSCPSNEEFAREAVQALQEYSNLRIKFLEKVSISVTSTYGDFPRFFFISPKNLIDNQFSKSSFWQANIGDADQAIVLDLGEVVSVNAFAWKSDEGHANPTNYKIFTSDDKKSWRKVIEIKNNSLSNKVEVFPEAILTRYLKFSTQSTKLGQPVKLYEVEALAYPAYILQTYQSFEKLLSDMFQVYCHTSKEGVKQLPAYQWGKVSWTTDLNSTEERSERFYLDGRWRKYSVPIRSLEAYSNSTEILREKLDAIIIFPGFLGTFEIRGVSLQPRGYSNE